MSIKAFIFDLDGTLLNTLDDIAVATNRALAELGFAEHPIAAYRDFVGHGAAELAVRALPSEASDSQQLLLKETMLRYYRSDWNTRTRPYPGIVATLTALAEGGKALGVLSNKPHSLVIPAVRYYFPEIPFESVYGAGEPFPLKPDPTGAFTIAEQLGHPPSELAFVGDSPIDIQTAQATGMISIGVTWGFRGRLELSQAGARYLVDHPSELIERVLRVM